MDRERPPSAMLAARLAGLPPANPAAGRAAIVIDRQPPAVVNSLQPGRASAASKRPSQTAEPEPLADHDSASWWQPDQGVRILKAAPPWLISLLLHMLLLLILGLSFVPQVGSRVLQLTLSYAETLGDQLDQDSVRVSIEPTDAREVVITPADLPPVENPFYAPPQMDLDPSGLLASSNLSSPEVGLALSGREQGSKEVLLAAYGGTALTESAVTEGLNWLQRNQLKDGTWSLTGPYGDGSYNENPTAATAMALLAFQGAGHTPKSTGPYQKTVTRGCDALLKMQRRDGDFFRGQTEHHRLYSQAQATIAVCELYAMTQDSRWRMPAQRAVDYAVKIQDSQGGWRYQPGTDSDTSVTGWFVMGLQSARMAGLEVPAEVFERVSGYLDRAAVGDGSRYGYQPGMEGTYSMTAEALLCRQYLGWKRDDRRLLTGVNLIRAYPMSWQERDVYYWYYATQVLHHLAGAEWDEWNAVMRQMLPENQTKDGPERGSWSPSGDRWGPHGGRLYVTCLSIYMLEVYYRHLPLYSSAATATR